MAKAITLSIVDNFVVRARMKVRQVSRVKPGTVQELYAISIREMDKDPQAIFLPEALGKLIGFINAAVGLNISLDIGATPLSDDILTALAMSKGNLQVLQVSYSLSNEDFQSIARIRTSLSIESTFRLNDVFIGRKNGRMHFSHSSLPLINQIKKVSQRTQFDCKLALQALKTGKEKLRQLSKDNGTSANDISSKLTSFLSRKKTEGVTLALINDMKTYYFATLSKILRQEMGGLDEINDLASLQKMYHKKILNLHAPFLTDHQTYKSCFVAFDELYNMHAALENRAPTEQEKVSFQRRFDGLLLIFSHFVEVRELTNKELSSAYPNNLGASEILVLREIQLGDFSTLYLPTFFASLSIFNGMSCSFKEASDDFNLRFNAYENPEQLMGLFVLSANISTDNPNSDEVQEKVAEVNRKLSCVLNEILVLYQSAITARERQPKMLDTYEGVSCYSAVYNAILEYLSETDELLQSLNLTAGFQKARYQSILITISSIMRNQERSYPENLTVCLNDYVVSTLTNEPQGFSEANLAQFNQTVADFKTVYLERGQAVIKTPKYKSESGWLSNYLGELDNIRFSGYQSNFFAAADGATFEVSEQDDSCNFKGDLGV